MKTPFVTDAQVAPGLSHSKHLELFSSDSMLVKVYSVFFELSIIIIASGFALYY